MSCLGCGVQKTDVASGVVQVPRNGAGIHLSLEHRKSRDPYRRGEKVLWQEKAAYRAITQHKEVRGGNELAV